MLGVQTNSKDSRTLRVFLTIFSNRVPYSIVTTRQSRDPHVGEPNPRLVRLLFVALTLLFLPTWLWLINAWLSDPYYSHGPLVILISVYFAWARRTRAGDAPLFKSSYLGWVVMIAALAIHLWASIWRAYYISALTIPFAVGGLLLTLYGWQIARRFTFPLAFLFSMVPLPIAERVGPMLESWTATSATMFARFLGGAARNDGAQVFLPNSTFTVGSPCGGLRSATAIITLTTLFAYILNGRLSARLALFWAAIPLALAANTVRIALLFAIASAWSSDVAMNCFHDWSSPVLFVCVFAFIIGLAKRLGASQIRWEVRFP
jgi:exosortase